MLVFQIVTNYPLSLPSRSSRCPWTSQGLLKCTSQANSDIFGIFMSVANSIKFRNLVLFYGVSRYQNLISPVHLVQEFLHLIFFSKLQDIIFWDIEGNTETLVTEKTRRNWRGNWSRTRTRKKLLTVSTVISNYLCIH